MLPVRKPVRFLHSKPNNTLITLHVYDPLVLKQPPKTGLLPNETESVVLDYKRHAGCKISPTEARGSAGSSVPELHSLKSDAGEPGDAARMLRRSQRFFR